LSYATSSETLSLKMSEQQKKTLKQNLAGLNHISVREKNLVPLFQAFTDKEIFTVLDPTLLLDKNSYEKLDLNRPPINEAYLFVFQVLKNPKTTILAKRIASSKGLKIIELLSGFNKIILDWRLQSCGPKDFLSLIKYSDFVVTTSFHGAAFAVIFEKDFYSVDTGGANRQKSFLESISLGERFISDIKRAEIDNPIDYKIVQKRLLALKTTSESYLEKINNG